MLNYFPKWIVIITAIGVAVFEVASRLPDVMLFSQRLTGQAGEYGGEAQSPAAVAAQIEQTRAAAEQAQTQARLNAMQTQVAQLQGLLTQTETAKAEAEKRLTQAQITGANLDNTRPCGRNP